LYISSPNLLLFTTTIQPFCQTLALTTPSTTSAIQPSSC